MNSKYPGWYMCGIKVWTYLDLEHILIISISIRPTLLLSLVSRHNKKKQHIMFQLENIMHNDSSNCSRSLKLYITLWMSPVPTRF